MRFAGSSLPRTSPNRGHDAHARRVAYLAGRLEHRGVNVVVSLISPYRASRDFARGTCRNCMEVHIATSLVIDTSNLTVGQGGQRVLEALELTEVAEAIDFSGASLAAGPRVSR